MKYVDLAHITFANPEFFFLLLLLPLMLLSAYKQRKQKQIALQVTTLQGIPNSSRNYRKEMLLALRLLAVIAFVIALARPQHTQINESIDSEGVDIVLSMDISGSMLAEDFQPNRLEASKKEASEFIANRVTDRVGLVIFSGESFTQCPLTTDQNILQEHVQSIQSGLLQDGTAIGMGLATAVDRLRMSKVKSKIIILLTDGVNNTGLIDPITALEIAKAYKIRVYTIGVGSEGTAPYPVPDAFGNIQMQQMPVQIDEELLRKIAKETGGNYFRATNTNSLRTIYNDIDKMEKTKIEISSYKRYAELFVPYALLGIISIMLEFVLRFTIFRRIP